MNIVVESPFAGDVGANREYLLACLKDCLARGENPYASHAYLPDVLDDMDPGERLRGLGAGHSISRSIFKDGGRWAFYVDKGVSNGMVHAFESMSAEISLTRIYLRSLEHKASFSLEAVYQTFSGSLEHYAYANPDASLGEMFLLMIDKQKEAWRRTSF